MRPLLSACLMLAALLGLSETAGAVTITSKTESTPYPGVRVWALRTSSPTTRAWAAFIDLCNDYVHMDATKAPTSLRTTGAWADAAGAQLATNGDFYKTGPVRVYGQAVGGAAPWPLAQTGADTQYSSEWYYQRYGWIAFGHDWVDFNHTEWVKKNSASYPTTQGWRPKSVTHAMPAGTLALVSGFPELVVEGKVVTCSSPTATSCFTDRTDMRARHPRTAMGLTKDLRTFILLVVDGRTTVSVGMYGTELAELMGKLGAWQAFNLDGGGSSQMWLQGKNYLNDASGNNSGAGLRAVANHWGVFAGSASGKPRTPGHCMDNFAARLGAAVQQQAVTTDLDGDGKADACIRATDGVRCALATQAGFGADTLGPKLSDASGWDDAANAGTLRMGDIDGDGRADLCARGNDTVQCWTSASSPLGTAVSGPALSDASGWKSPWYYATLRLADINADGKDDLCARAAAGFRCYLSNGSGFGAAIATTPFADAAGFKDVRRYGTLRMGDVNGDGKADVCGRQADGMECHLSDGKGFPTVVAGPGWSDASGWLNARFWATIRLVDVNGDGKADLCARTQSGFRCHLSQGAAFGPAISTAILTDASGWDDVANYATIRMGDIDGDGDADLCARGNARMLCWPWTGNGFGSELQGPEWSDAKGWNADRFFTSLRLADVTGDKKADLCARSSAGLLCFASDGKAFPTQLKGPGWGGVGWEHPSVYGTLSIETPPCKPAQEVCNGADDDCDGQVDEGCPGPDSGTQEGGAGGGAGSGGSGGGVADGSVGYGGQGVGGGDADGSAQGGAPAQDSGLYGHDYDAGSNAGCGCRAAAGAPPGAMWLWGVAAALLRHRGTRRQRRL
jgi:hypothetical protein